MSTEPLRLQNIFALIDAANSADPSSELVAGQPRPKELLYGERMSERLASFRADAGELLQIAVRAQHIERWRLARDEFPAGRSGYLRWRTTLAKHHAEKTVQLMQRAGYAAAELATVASLLRKEGLAGSAADGDVQVLEDVACLVFVEHYLPAFTAKHPPEKVQDILDKTLRKMSPAARSAASIAGGLR